MGNANGDGMAEAITGEVRKSRWGQSSMVLGPPMLWVALWLSIGVLLNASQLWLFQSLWILAALPFLAHALWGVWLAAIYLLEIFKRSDRQFVLAFYTMLLLLPGLALLSVSPILRDIGDRAVFIVRKAEYDRVVAEVAAGVSPALLPWSMDNRIGGFSFDSANPKLIVFRWFNGVPDGGSAIVYDETDSVQRIEQEGYKTVSPQLPDLLVGEPMSCERYADTHYFMCYFS